MELDNELSRTARTCGPPAARQFGQADAQGGEFLLCGFGVRATRLSVATLRVGDFGHGGVENHFGCSSSQPPRADQRGRRGADLTDGQLGVFPPAVVAAFPTRTGALRR